MGQMESVVFDTPAGAGPTCAQNFSRAWTEAHFEQPVVASGLSIGRAVVVSDPAALRRVLLENCDNSEKIIQPASGFSYWP